MRKARFDRFGLVGGLVLGLVLAFGVTFAWTGSQEPRDLCMELQPCLATPLEDIATSVQSMATALLAGSRRSITFPNGTGGAVFDIHVEFNQGVTIESGGAFEEWEGDGTGSPDLFDDEAGPGVAAGGNLTIIVRGSGSARPRVNRWWWTNRQGQRQGSVNNSDPGT